MSYLEMFYVALIVIGIGTFFASLVYAALQGAKAGPQPLRTARVRAFEQAIPFLCSGLALTGCLGIWMLQLNIPTLAVALLTIGTLCLYLSFSVEIVRRNIAIEQASNHTD